MSSTKKRLWRGGLVCAVDLLALTFSFLIAFWLRFSQVLIPAHRGLPPFSIYSQALLIVLPIYLWMFRAQGLYQVGRHIRRVEQIFTVIKSVTIGSLVLMALTFFYRDFSYSRLFLIFLWFFAAVLVSLFRYGLIQWVYRLRRQEKDLHRVLLVGCNRNARNLIEWTQQNPHLGHRVEGVLAHDKDLVGKHLEGVPIVGTLEECNRFIKAIQPDEILVADASLPREKVAELLLQCENDLVSFKVAADLYGIVTSNLDVEYIANVPLLGLRALPLDDFWNRFLKRFLDLTVSVLLMGFTLPFWVCVAIIMKLTGGDSVLYAQERVGQDEKHFKLYKFRTMRPDAEQITGPVWTSKDDERCTKIGRILRRFNLDELPQLWNVFRGDMSLVGLRPERPHFVDQFRGEIPRYMARHKIKSGITGWAQVNGLRGNTSLQERIKYDLYYAENWSFLFDLEILFMTLFAFKNAY